MSLIEQLAAKAQVTGDVGEKLDKGLDEAQAQAHRLQGGAIWVKESIKGVMGLSEHIRKDFEAGKFDGLDGKAVHDLLLTWNGRAVECLSNFSELKRAESLGAEGRVIGIRTALELVQKHHESVSRQAANVMAVMDTQPLPEAEAREARKARGPGEHPGPSPLDERRRAAALERQASSEPETAPADVLPMPNKKARKSHGKKIAG